MGVEEKDSGFTLVELVVTLVLLGFMGLGAGMMLVNGVEGFLFAKINNESFQKVNLAMERLSREAKKIDRIYGFSPGSIQYQRDGQDFTVAFKDGDIKISRARNDGSSGEVLIHGVDRFAIECKDVDGNNWAHASDNKITGLSLIEMTLGVTINNVQKNFTITINPLYNSMVNGPTS